MTTATYCECGRRMSRYSHYCRKCQDKRSAQIHAETLQTVTTDSMFGAAGMLSREWGDCGYRIGIQTTDGRGGAVFGCRHSDGSEFFIYADRWGNARQIEPDGRGVFVLLKSEIGIPER